MAAKTWERDFRYPAIQASVRALADADPEDPFEHPGSFCIPIAKKPLVGWTVGRTMLIAMVLGFALLIGGVVLGSSVEQDGGPRESLLVTLAAACSVSGILMFLLPVKFDRFILSWLIGRRGRDLTHRASGAKILSAEVSDTNRANMKITIDGDDHVLILFDEQHHRLLMEGQGARYQIRADDVEKLLPFEFMNYLGAEIVCRIDSQTHLRVALARVSMLLEVTRQLPFLFFLRKRIKNKVLQHCQRTLQAQTHLV